MKALHRILSLLAPVVSVPNHIFRTATRYGTKSSGRNDALQKAGLRESDPGQELSYFYDITASLTQSTNDVIRFGPFPGGSVPVTSSIRIIGDNSTDLGDDIDVGYAFVDSSDGTDDPNAFMDAENASAGNIDKAGLVNSKLHNGPQDPIPKPYWITITTIDATGAAAGTVALECFVRQKN